MTYEPRICPVCEREFQMKLSQPKRCCSAECSANEIVACAECGESFRKEHNSRRFCSKKCRNRAAYRRTPLEQVECHVCGVTYERRRVNRPGRCAACMHPSGEGHPQWKGGEHFNTALGRWTVTTPEGPMYRYRWVMEQHLGRKLRSDEHVHHINGDRTDDRLENLQVLGESEHHALHGPQIGELHRSRMKYLWSKEHECCVECGTKKRKHVGHGKCSRCYFRELHQTRVAAQRQAA